MCCLVLRLLNSFEDVLVQPFTANGAIVTLDIGVLLRLARLDVLKSNTVFLSPRHQCPADIFGAVVRCLTVDCKAINEKGHVWFGVYRAT